MMKNKVIVKVVFPSIDKTYDIKIPVNEVLWKINKLIVKAIYDMNGMKGPNTVGKDIGFVGDIKNVDAKILFDLLDADFLPIVAPIGLDDEFNTYNINADDAACEIAKAVGADKLAFLTDIDGLFRDLNDPTSLISRITTSDARGLINGGFIGGGMLPKLGNCIQAVEDGVRSVHILDGRIPHCLLLEIFTKKGIGTMIISDNDPIRSEE